MVVESVKPLCCRQPMPEKKGPPALRGAAAPPALDSAAGNDGGNSNRFAEAFRYGQGQVLQHKA